MTDRPDIDSVKGAARRPRSVTLLSLLVLSIAGFNLVRLVQTIGQWNFILDLGAISPLYLATGAVFWIIVGALIFWGLWIGKPWAPVATCVVGILYIVWFWLDNQFVMDPAGRGLNLIFQLSMQLVLLSLIFIILSRPATKTYFRRNI